MADISGTAGNATLANININVTEWSASIEADEVAIPPTMSDVVPWENGAVGAQRCRGSLTGKVDDGNIPVDPTAHTNFSGAAVLTAHTAKTLSGNMVYENVAITRRLADVEITCDFRNAGAFTTW